jgi:hypothetical protein
VTRIGQPVAHFREADMTDLIDTTKELKEVDLDRIVT